MPRITLVGSYQPHNSRDMSAEIDASELVLRHTQLHGLGGKTGHRTDIYAMRTSGWGRKRRTMSPVVRVRIKQMLPSVREVWVTAPLDSPPETPRDVDLVNMFGDALIHKVTTHMADRHRDDLFGGQFSRPSLGIMTLLAVLSDYPDWEVCLAAYGWTTKEVGYWTGHEPEKELLWRRRLLDEGRIIKI